DLEDLIIGFLASEGAIRFYHEIGSLSVDASKGFAYVETSVDRSMPADDYMKRTIGSCCGKSRHFYFQNDQKTAQTARSQRQIGVQACYARMQDLQRFSEAFQQTGGVHNAALCSPDQVMAVRTDIGRHNGLDKLYGYAMRYHLS